GQDNTSTNSHHTVITGGYENDLLDLSDFSVISGGYSNQSQGILTGIFGGQENSILSTGIESPEILISSFILGGLQDFIMDSISSVIVGGYINSILDSTHSGIYGGIDNMIHTNSNISRIASSRESVMIESELSS